LGHEGSRVEDGGSTDHSQPLTGHNGVSDAKLLAVYAGKHQRPEKYPKRGGDSQRWGSAIEAKAVTTYRFRSQPELPLARIAEKDVVEHEEEA
jgi:hypothetical protein